VPLFSINLASNVPVYEQIVDGLRYAIASGTFAAGDQLPSVRQLAVELLVNPNTVAKAYRELEREGLTRTRPGLGVFVSEAAPRLCLRHRRRAVADRIAAAIHEALASGLDPEEVRALAEEVLEGALEGARRG